MSSSVSPSEVVESIRDSNRRQFEDTRKEARYKTTRIHRSGLDLQPQNFKKEDVVEMAAFLKAKKGIDRAFLAKLSRALAQSELNAAAFVSKDGAIQALCSFLTGGESMLQLETTYCIANLALWEDEKKSFSTTANVFGAYLVTLLGSGNPLVQEGCCWALGNMFPQGSSVLFAQGLTQKLNDLLNSSSMDTVNAAIQCLVQLVGTSSPLSEDLVSFASTAVLLTESKECDIASLCWLLSLLSYHESCDEMFVTKGLPLWVIQVLREELARERRVVVIIPLVRCLNNLSTVSGCLKSLLTEKDFLQLLQQLLNFSYESVCKETFVCVANIVNCRDVEVQHLVASIQMTKILEKSLSCVSCLFLCCK